MSDIKSIIVLGDSVAKGVLLNPEKKRYFFSKEGFIKTISDKLLAKVTNLSKFGMTTSHWQNILDKNEQLNADLVLIEYGGNDCDYNWDEVAQTPLEEHLPNTLSAKFEQNLKKLVLNVKQRHKIPVLMNLPPLDADRYFHWFTKGDRDRANNILEWLRDISKIYWWQEKYSYIIEKVAHNTDTRFINVRSAFLTQDNYRDFICEDGIHPNQAGQTLMHHVLEDYINKHASYIMA
ncbi:MAG: SGNH/GDSL hydrolase family protein [Christensenellaceae bacterium]